MRQRQKAYIIKTTLIVFMLFVFAISTSFAAVNIPPKLFEFSKDAKTGHIDTSENPTVNVGTNNRIKVCRNVACDNPGIINFEISGDSPFVIDTEKGLSGRVWGGDLGWVTFNPPYGGVFFADSATGLLKGTAWSETSGAINFSVTGQKVVIDPVTGEWNGWAWASGPYGGWVKFDCKNASCVRIIWDTQNIIESTTVFSPPPTPSSSPTSTELPVSTFIKTGEIVRNVLDNFYLSFVNLSDGTIQLASNSYNSLFSSLKNFQTSLFDEVRKINGSTFAVSWEQIKKINGGAFTTSASNLKNFLNRMAAIKYEMADVLAQKFGTAYDSVSQAINDTYNSVAFFLVNIFAQNSLVNKNEPSPADIRPRAEFLSGPDLGEKIRVVALEKSKIMSNNLSVFIAGSADIFKKMTVAKYRMFDEAGENYYYLFSNLISLRSSVLEAVSNLIK